MLSNSFKWIHYEGEIVLLNLRWYLKYPVSYRNLKEMMIGRGVQVDHTTLMRWVHIILSVAKINYYGNQSAL
jgi:transposase, IS6 family